MNPLVRNTSVLLAALVCGAGPGCAASGAPTGGATQAAAPARWVVAPGKPNGSGVTLRYAAPEAIKLRQSVTVQLQLSNITAALGARVEVRGSDPALNVLVDGAAPAGPISMGRDEVRDITVQVSSAVDGLYYLNVFTTQDGRLTASSVPLLVGTGQPRQKVQGNVQTTPSGEKVISLPAR